MTPDNDPSAAGDARRRNGKPTTIDLTATEVASSTAAAPIAETPAPAESPTDDAAQSEPASGSPSGAESGTASPAEEIKPAVTVDSVPEAQAVAEAMAGPGGEPSDGAKAHGTGEPVSPSAQSSDVTGEPFTTSSSTIAPTPPAPDSEPRRGSGMSLVAAAIVGGILGVGGSALLITSGKVVPPPTTAAVTPEMVGAVDSRVGDLDQRLARLETAPAPAPDAGLVDRIGQLEQTVSNLPAPDPAIAQRLSDIEAAVKTLPAQDAPVAPDVEGLRTAVAGLTERLDALPPPPVDLSPRVDAVAAAVESLKAGATDSRQILDRLAAQPVPVDPARIDALEKGLQDIAGRIATLETGVAGLRQALGDEVGGVRKSLDDGLSDVRRSLGEQIDGLRTAQASTASAAETLGARVGDIEQRLDAGPKGGEIAALSLAVTTLSSRIAAGEPFAADLAVVEKTAPDLPEVQALRPIAEQGVSSIDALVESMPVSAMMDARPVTSDSGVLDRVFSGAKSLVNYRETGPGTDDPASQAIEAIRAALATGDSQAAKAAADGLPDWAKAPAAEWLGRLDARATADAAVQALTGKVLDRLQAPAEGR